MRESEFVPRKDFELIKVKIQNNGGLAVSYVVKEKNGQELYVNEFMVKKSANPAPELTNCLLQLKPMVSQSLGIKSIKDSLEAIFTQLDSIDRVFDEWENDLTVTGITVVAGGVMVMASVRHIGLTTQKLEIAGDSMVNLMKTLGDEVYQYIFCNKTLQLDLFDEDGEPTQEALM